MELERDRRPPLDMWASRRGGRGRRVPRSLPPSARSGARWWKRRRRLLVVAHHEHVHPDPVVGVVLEGIERTEEWRVAPAVECLRRDYPGGGGRQRRRWLLVAFSLRTHMFLTVALIFVREVGVSTMWNCVDTVEM